MGAWGHGVFENDDAMDWVTDLLESSDLAAVTAALAAVVEAEVGEEIDAGDGAAALAAAEVVAALAGQPLGDLPDNVGRWIRRRRAGVNECLLDYALRAVRKVRAQSELKNLWQESAQYKDWLTVLADLKQRLS